MPSMPLLPRLQVLPPTYYIGVRLYFKLLSHKVKLLSHKV